MSWISCIETPARRIYISSSNGGRKKQRCYNMLFIIFVPILATAQSDQSRHNWRCPRACQDLLPSVRPPREGTGVKRRSADTVDQKFPLPWLTHAISPITNPPSHPPSPTSPMPPPPPPERPSEISNPPTSWRPDVCPPNHPHYTLGTNRLKRARDFLDRRSDSAHTPLHAFRAIARD